MPSLDNWMDINENKPKLLIDGHYLAYKIMGISKLRKLKSNGRRTGIPFGIINTLKKLIKEGYRDIEFAWDIGIPQHRYRLLTAYKEGRKGGLSLSSGEIDLTQDFLKYMGIDQYWHGDLEGDDVIASRCKQIDGKKVIYTVDKDFFQLLDDDEIKIKKSKDLIGRKHIKREYGIEPSEMVEYLALIGDNVDNIDGVNGIGPVTAQKYINGVEISDNKEEKILEAMDKVECNKKLIKLRVVDELECIEGKKNINHLDDLLHKYEMDSLYGLVNLI